MYIYGEERPTGKTIDAFPCFICKKMIINSGLDRVISSMKDVKKKYKIFSVNEWVKDWQKHDIIEDKYKYGE